MDVKVSKVDWVMPPFIDMQLIDGVTLLDNQGDDKAKENQSKVVVSTTSVDLQ